MTSQLKAEFFDRPALVVARELLGKFLVRNLDGNHVALMLTEVEAYDGPEDLACHASRGRTARNAPLYGKAGEFYVYRCYGIHWMLNVVTGPLDYPAAILIRGGEVVDKKQPQPIIGPGRLTKFLQIDHSLNTKNASKESGLWFEDRGISVPAPDILATARIGVDYAGSVWAKKRYRFVLKHSLHPEGMNR